MSQEDFKKSLAFAREKERGVASLIQKQGYYVLPAYDFSGEQENKAPKLLAPLGKRPLVLPDLFCMKSDLAFWLEVKWKTEAYLFRKANRRTTGINLRLWEYYIEVEKESSFPVWIMFLHKKEQEIRAGSLSFLRDNICYTGRDNNGKMMVYWNYDLLQVYGSLSLIEAIPCP